MQRLLRWVHISAAIAVAALITIAFVFAVQARLRLPELRPWHTVSLEQEFHAGSATTFPEYLALEERLFAELRRRLLDVPGAADRQAFGAITRKGSGGAREGPSTTARSSLWRRLKPGSSSARPRPFRFALQLAGTG